MKTSTPTPPTRFPSGQLDYRIKLVCPRCGAVVHTFAKSLSLSGSIRCDGDGGTFAPAARRKYSRRVAVATA